MKPRLILALAALPASAALAQSTRPASDGDAMAEVLGQAEALQRQIVNGRAAAPNADWLFITTEPQPFLGVTTAPLDDAAREMAELPEGVGLVVRRVVEDSPAAAAGVAAGDVLHKLGDQLLVNADQLRTLVRTNAAGDDVELRVLRGGEPMTLTATLEERDVPVSPANLRFRLREGGPGVLRLDFPPTGPGGMGDDRQLEQIEQRMREIEEQMRRMGDDQGDGAADPDQRQERDTPDSRRARLNQELLDALGRVDAVEDLAKRIVDGDTLRLDEANQNLARAANEAVYSLRELKQLRERLGAAAGARVIVSDDDGTAQLSRDAGGPARFVVTDADGETIYDGPVPPKGERGDLPAEVRRRLDQVEKYAPAVPTPPVPPAPPPARPSAPADAA